ncbi:MAG: heme o synthase, partial [Acidobacteria bacterium]|nr:heme o synthase [Acidobacteriota bacterium]
MNEIAVTSNERTVSVIARDFMELSKVRIVFMILITTAAGFAVGAQGAIDFILLVHTMIGTSFVAIGANSANQVIERDYDALMRRTSRRPLPDHRMSTGVATTFTLFVTILGLAWLALEVNVIASTLAGITWVTYLGLYTPLKRVTSLSTLIGSVPGAIPPMIGWAAATGGLSSGAWAMFGILFLWQMPHFYALAHVYRDDYDRGGLRMLSVVDSTGVRVARQSVFYSALLLAVSVVPTTAGLLGWLYGAGAIGLGMAMLVLSVRF